MSLLVKLFEVLFPVFLTIGIGYWYGRKDPRFNTKFFTTFAGNIGLPCIIFYSLTVTEIDFYVYLKFAYFTLVYIAIFSAIGLIILKILKKDISRLLPPFILPNTGNMGIPICLFAYGNSGLAIATAITSIILVLHFTLNILLASKRFSIKPLIESVPVYTLIFSLIFVYFKIPVPTFLENATFLIGYSTIFIVLMSLGIGLSKIKVFNYKETLIYSLTRVIVGPIVGFGFVNFFDLTGVEAGVMFIQASMPSAILTYLIARIYSPKRIYNTIAETAALSTFLSFFTLIVVVFISLKYFN
tara:strand:- start:372 stop:1271 length:900 start_codon:yes stop_codon:yes gene_type:complete